MRIKRNIYLDRIADCMNDGMIKVITGVRRSGKSFLLFELFYEYLISQNISEDHIIRLSLDDDDNAQYRDAGRLHSYIKEKITDNENYYILLDEVQYAISKDEMRQNDSPIRLYGVLNSFLRKNNVDVYVTGSNSKFLSRDVMTEFRGRGEEIHIQPLSFSEYYPFHGGSKEEAMSDYLLYGGLPHILSIKTEEGKVRYLSKVFEEVYLKDILERYDIKNRDGFEELAKILASSVGSMTNPQKISATFASSGISSLTAPTISEYIQYLCDSYIIMKTERYDIKGRKYISTPKKYYYSDVGLRNALLNFRQYEETHLMENLIYNELIYRGYNVDVGVVEINTSEAGKRVHKQLEIDFVANLGNKRYYIQSAYAIPDDAKMRQEQESLIRVPDSFKKMIVVYGHTHIWRNEHGITIMNIWDFLLNNDSLDY